MARTRRRKRHTQKPDAEAAPAQGGGVPRSFVLKRGRLAALVDELADDVRKVMEPHTAKNLKERKQNKLKDFIHVAGPLGVSHFVLLSATERSRYLRIAKAPRGPTATWRVTSYAHASDIAAAQARPRAPESAFRTPPLVVLNNFGTEPHMKLAAIMFQNMFPAVNVHTVKLSATQRVLLVDYDRASGRFRLRHYSISAKQLGVNRRLRRLLTNREVPDLGNCDDVADFLSRAVGDASDSEGEDGAAARVTLAQDVRGAGNTSGSQSAIRLQEIGPRMDLELLKVEEGLCGGAVLYHAHVSKTADEAAQLEREAREKEAGKIARRVEQEGNVERKREANEAREAARTAAREARMAARQAAAGEEADGEDAEGDYGDEEEDESDGDDDDEEPERPAARASAQPPPHKRARTRER